MEVVSHENGHYSLVKGARERGRGPRVRPGDSSVKRAV